MTHEVWINVDGLTHPVKPAGVVLIDPTTGLPVAPAAQGLTDTQLRAAAVPVAVQGLGIPAHTNLTLAYTGSNLTTVVYKNGATTVATVTLTYDASNNITSVTKA